MIDTITNARRPSLLAAVAAVALALTPEARADAGQDEALAAFNQGKELFGEKKFSEAAVAFRRAHELKPNWKLNYNIGQSEAAAKRHGAALQAFEAYLSQGGDDIVDSRREEVVEEVRRLRDIVGFLQVKAPDGATVRIDGVRRGTAPMHGQIPVAASVDHRVVVSVGVEELPAQMVNVTGGQTVGLEFGEEKAEEPASAPQIVITREAPAPAPEPEPAPPEEPKGNRALRGWGWALFAVGGTALLAGGVSGGVALGLDEKIKKDCPDGDCPPEKHSQLDDRDSQAVITDVLLGVGGAITVAGIVMVVVAKRRKSKSEQVSVRPMVTPEVAGAAVEWRF